MSLLVWLPLVRDYSNQGLDNAIPALTSSNSSIVAGGKLGNCLHLNDVGEINTNCNINANTTSLSFGGWYKFNKAEIQAVIDTKTYSSTNKTSTGNLIGNNSYGGIGLIFVTNDLYSNNKILTTFGVFANLRATGVNKSTSITSLDFDVWYHIFTVVDKDNLMLSLYIDGELFSRVTLSEYTDVSTRNLFLNYKHVAGGNAIAISPPCYANDIRIYDHALSVKEIKELSKGLVAHYKLTGALDGINPNMLKDVPKSYASTSYRAYQLNLTENLMTGETYTIQFWDVNVSHTGKTASNLGINIYWGGGNVSLISLQGTSNFTDGHADYLTKTITITSSQASGSGATNLWLEIYNSTPSATGDKTMSIGKWKLEKGSVATPYVKTAEEMGIDETIVYDCSGYNYHGMVSGTLTASSDTARYTASTVFNGINSYIESDTLPTEAKTISIWAKSSWASTTDTKSVVNDKNSKLAIVFWKNNTLLTYVGTTYGGSGSAVLTTNKYIANQWNHIVVVKTGDTTRNVYINGELISPTSNNWTYNDLNKLFIGARNYNGYSGYFDGQLSDFRAYATALSADDILELYHTGASIDKDGNMYAYELKEV